MNNINLYCPINSTGYGVASINILKKIYQTNNIDVHLTPIGSIACQLSEDIDIIKKILSNEYINNNAPCLKIWHQFDLATRVGIGKFFVYPFFEIDKFTNREIMHLNLSDEIFVSSQWAKDIILSNKIDKPVHIAPLGVDTKVFDHKLFDDTTKKYDKYVFITVGKWEIRKSHDIIIELFNSAFETNDNVELWMITHNPFLNKEEEDIWHNIVLKSKLSDKIKIFPHIQSQVQLAEIISYASCGLYVSRAEGWNLDLLETMALNKPVIVTNYSAHTEYCDENNAYLIDITESEPAQDNKWFDGRGNWAKIGPKQKDSIIDYMRYVYKNNINTNQPGYETAKKLSWENTAQKILQNMIS